MHFGTNMRPTSRLEAEPGDPLLDRGEDWYRTSEGLPPFNIPVYVNWSGRIFIARLGPDLRRKRQIRWLIESDHGLIAFPPRGLAKKLGEHPQVWRPMDPKRWVWMLPEPVPHLRPPLSSPIETPPPDDPSGQWWRDEAQVRRGETADVPREEAEARVLRALCTMRTIVASGPRDKTSADVLARISASPLSLLLDEAVEIHHDWRPRFEPSGKDLDDFLVASRWFEALNPPEMGGGRRPGRFNRAQMALVLRSINPPWSWSRMADKWGVSPERAKQIYQSSVEKVWRAANGLTVHRHLPKSRAPLVTPRSSFDVHLLD